MSTIDTNLFNICYFIKPFHRNLFSNTLIVSGLQFTENAYYIICYKTITHLSITYTLNYRMKKTFSLS